MIFSLRSVKRLPALGALSVIRSAIDHGADCETGRVLSVEILNKIQTESCISVTNNVILEHLSFKITSYYRLILFDSIIFRLQSILSMIQLSFNTINIQ